MLKEWKLSAAVPEAADFARERNYHVADLDKRGKKEVEKVVRYIKMNKKSRSIFTLIIVFAIIAVLFMMGTGLAFADEETAEAVQGFDKGLASAIAIGLASMGGAVAMGIATGKSTEAISRQPEAEGKIRTTFILGLVFIETAIIYALVVVILIAFVI